MSDTDSFIDEVSEEVRRDRFYRLLRKYGWIPISLVLLLVGSAAYFEWSKARAAANAQALGSEILQAVRLDDPDGRLDALRAISARGDTSVLLALLASNDAILDSNADAAITALVAVANDEGLSSAYRDLAELKLILLQSEELPVADKVARLEAIAAPGAPYRLLAEEQLAIVDASAGDTDAALQRLQAILADDEVTAGLRRRVSQLIVALGGELAPA